MPGLRGYGGMTVSLLIVAFPVLAGLRSEVGLRVIGVFFRFVSQ